MKWDDLDLSNNQLLIRGTYVRKEKRFKDIPKGGKEHWVALPIELREYLELLKNRSGSEYIVGSGPGEFMDYHAYNSALKRACKKAGVKSIGSHGALGP